MINSILATFIPGILEILIVLIFFSIPIALIVWFLKMLAKQKNENIRLRLEVGKLADELEKARKKDIDKKLIGEKE